MENIKDREEIINEWLEEFQKIGEKNEFTDEDLGDLEFLLAMLNEYDVIDLGGIQ